MVPMKKKRGVTAWLLAVAVRTVLSLMQVFPIDWNLRTARVLARIWMWVSPRHLDRAFTNLQASLGDEYSTVELKQIAKRCLESWTMFAVEFACMPRLINRSTWSRYVRLVNCTELVKIAIDGKGALLVSGHYGSFELVGQFLAALGLRVAAIMRPIDNTYLNDHVVATRRRHGLRLLDKKGAMADAEDIVRSGGLLAFVGDQDAGRKGIFVDFFGRPASTYKSIGLLAMATGCPVVVGGARRRGNSAQYDFVVERVIYEEEWEGRPDPLRWITQTYTEAIENMVREGPEQYLWIHRRWKTQPGQKRRSPKAAIPCASAGTPA